MAQIKIKYKTLRYETTFKNEYDLIWNKIKNTKTQLNTWYLKTIRTIRNIINNNDNDDTT